MAPFFLAVWWRPRMAEAQKGHPVQIFVGNLAFTVTEQDVRELFAPYGVVDRINLITGVFAYPPTRDIPEISPGFTGGAG